MAAPEGALKEDAVALAVRYAPRRAMLLAVVGALGGACASNDSAPGMDVVGRSMQRLGETLRARAMSLEERSGAGLASISQEALRAASERWRAVGEATAVEGARIVRAAGIIGQNTGGDRVPARASRVIVFAVEAEGEALQGAGRRLQERSRVLATAVSGLELAHALTDDAKSQLVADVDALATLAVEAGRAGAAMREQARRYRQALGQREGDTRW